MVYESTCERDWDLLFQSPHQNKTRWIGGRSLGILESEEEPTQRKDVEVRVKILDQLSYKYPCCPPDAFYNIREFYNSPNINHYDDNCKKIRVALRNWCCCISEWKVDDFARHYSNPGVTPYFNGYSCNVSDIYYSVDESDALAVRLLN